MTTRISSGTSPVSKTSDLTIEDHQNIFKNSSRAPFFGTKKIFNLPRTNNFIHITRRFRKFIHDRIKQFRNHGLKKKIPAAQRNARILRHRPYKIPAPGMCNPE